MKYVSNPDFLSVLLVFQCRVYGMHRKETKKKPFTYGQIICSPLHPICKVFITYKLLMITSIFFADSEVCLI